MSKKIRINYKNNKKINEMISKQEKLKKMCYTFGGLAIFSEIGAFALSPNIGLSAVAAASVISVGICANKVFSLEKKINHYIETHDNIHYE